MLNPRTSVCHIQATLVLFYCAFRYYEKFWPAQLLSVGYWFITSLIHVFSLCWEGTVVAQWLRCCATNRKVAGSIPAGISGFFIDINSFRSHCGPGVDSASNRNEYQEYLLGGKGGRCVRLTTLPPSCAVVIKCRNLNFLEPSGQLRACNGADVPLAFMIISWWIILKTRNVSDKIVEKLKTHISCSITLLRKSCCFWQNGRNFVQPDRPHMIIRRMRSACWISKI